jgi:DNA topoisomerase-1
VRQCHDPPGQELFQYVDDAGKRLSVDLADVNAYLRQIAGQGFTTKDFLTWAGSVLALEALQACGACESSIHGRTNVAQVIKTVTSDLGNTPAIRRKCYVHQAIIDAYLEGSLLQALQVIADRDHPSPLPGLSPQEWMALRIFQHQP